MRSWRKGFQKKAYIFTGMIVSTPDSGQGIPGMGEALGLPCLFLVSSFGLFVYSVVCALRGING